MQRGFSFVGLLLRQSGRRVDLFLDHVDGFSLFDLADLADHLEGLLGARVDLTTRDSLDRRLRAGIEARAERVL